MKRAYWAHENKVRAQDSCARARKNLTVKTVDVGT